MNRSAKGVLIVTTNLDGFSLVNCLRFAKVSTHQALPLYGSYIPYGMKILHGIKFYGWLYNCKIKTH